jgi:glycerophosphoryl diester phosphodiesterase
VVSSPARDRRRITARERPGEPGDHTTTAVQIVGHAGLAIQSEGGAPTRHHLDDALTLGIDRIEVDVCCSADGHLIVRHDVSLADGRFVADLDLAELGRAGPAVLTLDEVVEHLAGRVPLLLDIKMAGAAELLGPWLRQRRDPGSFAVCTENLPWLLHLRFAAPRVARWPSFPNLGDHRTHHVQRVVVGLWRSHASLGGLRRGVVDVQRAARHLRERPQESLANLAGLPWRGRLPTDVAQTREDISAAGMCVHHWVVSERLVEEAHSFGLHVNTWTVNNPFAALTAAAAGVDSITTDRVHLVRIALDSEEPLAPRLRAGRPVRAVVRIAPS